VKEATIGGVKGESQEEEKEKKRKRFFFPSFFWSPNESIIEVLCVS